MNRIKWYQTFFWIMIMPILGCTSNLGYILTVGTGQLNVLTHSVSLDAMIDDPDIDQDQHDKLLWVRDVRDYAQADLGLAVKKSYRSYYDTGDGPAVYNLSASRKDELKPLTWKFPVIGEIQYLGYFKADQAKAKAEELRNQNYDVTVYGAISYSTLGYFRDPVFSSILVLDKGELAEVVVHELTHNTIYKAGDSEFNESVATFVGQKGARQFITETLGADSELLTELDQRDEDKQTVNTFLKDFYEALAAYYDRTDLTSDEKIAGRDDLFQEGRDHLKNEIAPQLHNPENYASVAEMPANNAWILIHHRYNKNMDIFESVYQACGQNLIEAIKVFKLAEKETDSYQFLRDWLSEKLAAG